MRRSLTIIGIFIMAFSAKGQNMMGFDTMVKTLITNEVDTIGREELLTLIEDGDVVILDAREFDEYAVSHLENAQHVGYESFSLKEVKNIYKDQNIVVYCSVGYRSGLVAKQLKDAGYSDVFNLFGGIFDWTNHDLPVVDLSNEPVNRVHPYNKVWGFWVNKYDKQYEP